MAPPSNREWPRFLHYAARLRVLGKHITKFDPPLLLAHTTAFMLLGYQKPVQWLFPNLRCVEWQFDPDPECDTSSMLSLAMLLGPRVDDVTVMQVNPLPPWALTLMIDELRAFALSRTNLQHMKIYCTQMNESSAPLVPDIIKENKELRTLEVWQQMPGPLPRATWMEVAHLPRLEKTIVFVDEFLGTEDEQQELRSIPGPLFQFLSQVTIHADSTASFGRFLDFMHSSSLENIALIVTDAPTNVEVKTFFTKLTKHRLRASLRHFSFSTALPCPRNDDSYVITADTLRVLLAFRNLITCNLVLQCPMRPDNTFLLCAAIAWGKTLTSFDIGSKSRRRWRRPPVVTLTGLGAFVSCCPRLAHLGVEFTPNVADFQETYDAGIRPCPRASGSVGSFSTGASTLANLDEAQLITLAGILSDMFPMLLQLVSLWDREEDPVGDEDADDEDETERWRKVRAFTKAMAIVRLQERAWASPTDDEHNDAQSDAWISAAR